MEQDLIGVGSFAEPQGSGSPSASLDEASPCLENLRPLICRHCGSLHWDSPLTLARQLDAMHLPTSTDPHEAAETPHGARVDGSPGPLGAPTLGPQTSTDTPPRRSLQRDQDAGQSATGNVLRRGGSAAYVRKLAATCPYSWDYVNPMTPGHGQGAEGARRPSISSMGYLEPEVQHGDGTTTQPPSQLSSGSGCDDVRGESPRKTGK